MPSKGQFRPETRKALELLENGKARGFADAARIVGGISASGVANAWRSTHGEEAPSAWLEDANAEVEVQDESPRERELGAKLVRLEQSKSVAQAEARAAKREIEAHRDKIEKLEELLGIVEQVENQPSPGWMLKPKKKRDHRGILVASFSDYHVGEHVDPREMAWYNAYNMDIAEKRVRRFFERTILIPRQYLAGVKYDGVVLASLGDTISGDIHDEYRDTNELSNYDAIVEVIPWLEEGIGMLADEYEKVHVVCVPGNHPRDSKRPRYKKRSAHNADTLISKLVAKKFRNDDRVTFDIPDGISADFSVYETKFRVEHGDEATGGSGIQGAMLPLALRTHRVRKQAQAEGRPFDVLMMGHWHQLMSLPGKGFIVNGAGKGYDEFARAKGFEPEPPQQALTLVTPEYGISGQWPLYVSKRSDEGW